MHAAKKATRIKAIAYTKGLPGRDSLDPNIGLHGLINLCIKHPESMSDEQWIGVWEILNYRLGAIRAAEILAYRLGLKVPRASEWDKEAWMYDNRGSEVYQLACEYSEIICKAGPLPPPHGSRRRYDKPHWYLAAACAESGLPKVEMQARLKIVQKSKWSIDLLPRIS